MKTPIAPEILAHLPSTAVIRRLDGIAETYLKEHLIKPVVAEFIAAQNQTSPSPPEAKLGHD